MVVDGVLEYVTFNSVFDIETQFTDVMPEVAEQEGVDGMVIIDGNFIIA